MPEEVYYDTISYDGSINYGWRRLRFNHWRTIPCTYDITIGDVYCRRFILRRNVLRHVPYRSITIRPEHVFKLLFLTVPEYEHKTAYL